MHGTTVTVQPFGSEKSFTLDLEALYQQFLKVPDQRKRRGVRYPLAVLLTIAVWAKLAGYSQVRAIAGWAHERCGELADQFELPRARMPHPTTWSRVLGSAVAVESLQRTLTTFVAPPPAAQPVRARAPPRASAPSARTRRDVVDRVIMLLFPFLCCERRGGKELVG